MIKGYREKIESEFAKISLMSLTNTLFHQLPVVNSTIHSSSKEISVTLKTALLALNR